MTDKTQLLTEFIENQYFCFFITISSVSAFAHLYLLHHIRINMSDIFVLFQYLSGGSFFSVQLFGIMFSICSNFVTFIQLQWVGHMRSKVKCKSGHCFFFSIYLSALRSTNTVSDSVIHVKRQ